MVGPGLIMHIVPIQSLELPELAPYRTLRQNEEHRKGGFFVAEGDKVVRRLLESHFGVTSVLLPEKRLAEFEPLIRARTEDVPVYVIEIRELEKLTGFPFFQGVLAVGKIPQAHTVSSVLSVTRPPRLFVAVDGLTNSENVGLVVRNCAAFGAHGLLIDRGSASAFLRRAVRNSMGAVFKLPIVESDSLSTAIAELRDAGVRIIAAHAHTDQRTIKNAEFNRDCCIVLGSEGSGISESVLALCDEAVAIPMSNDVDSLNVGSAAAVFLYEAARQRGRH
jgi:tRNA G18 (ribose-2'-O)-methylase SpoU